MEPAVEFGEINEANLDQLRKLNVSVFPVRYNEKFYTGVLTTPKEVTTVKGCPHGYLYVEIILMCLLIQSFIFFESFIFALFSMHI